MEADKLQPDVLDALTAFDGNEPASSDAIEALRLSTHDKLPRDYLTFLSVHDGGEGAVGSSAYLMLWRSSEIAEMNVAYQVQQYAPGLMIIGSDGGGEAFAFDLRQERASFVQVPFVGMDLGLIEKLADSFADFIRYLNRYETASF